MSWGKSTPEQCGAVSGCGIGTIVAGLIVSKPDWVIVGIFQSLMAFVVLCIFAWLEVREIRKGNRDNELT